MTRRTHRWIVPALLLATAVSLSACAGSVVDQPAAAPAGHGAVAGAREMSEPQLGLAMIDVSGRMSHLDLLDESVAELGTVPPPTAASTDGRYVFSVGADGVTIVDSGRWTWDHVDHFHYYLADPRVLGTVAGSGPAVIATTTSSTTGGTGIFFAETGEAVLLDTHALSKGEIVERFRLRVEPHAGLVVPIGSFALVTEPQSGQAGAVRVVDGDGMPVAGVRAACDQAAGTTTTRVGAVIGCSDGALLATLVDGAVEIERIPYPPGAGADPARAFSGREGRPTVAGLEGDGGIWMLDTRARAWTLLTAPDPIVAVAAVDDEARHVVALSAEGRVLVLDGATGAVLSRTEPLLTAPAAGPQPGLFVDQSRAYATDPHGAAIHEIDFADGARIARTFDAPVGLAFTLGTGR